MAQALHIPYVSVDARAERVCVYVFGFYMYKHLNEAIIIRDGSQTFKWMLAFILLK